MILSRRRVLFAAGASAAALTLPVPLQAAAVPLELGWRDLVPEAERNASNSAKALNGVVQHGATSPEAPSSRPIAELVRQDLDGQLVKLPGYALPLEMEDVGVTEFLLVPYVGACVHVPPPPPNQMVLVKLAEPMVFTSLFEPVWVIGQMSTTINKVAGWLDVGYRLTANEVTPYESDR